jgi:hypothetical protein
MYAELNPRSIGKVLNAYELFKREELNRNPAVQPAALLAAPIPSQEQQDIMNANLFRMAYLAAEQKREYRDLGNLIYDWLDSKGLVTFSPTRKWDFMKQAQEKIRQEEAGHGVTGNYQEHKDARALAALLVEAQKENKLCLPLKDRITTRAKQIALTTLLSELIEFDTTADEFLTSNIDQDDEQAIP